MAIKGKSKKRGGGARRAAVAPKPVIVERQPPFLARPKVKRALLALLILAVVLGGLRVWENIGRSHALKRYDDKFRRATGLLQQHVDSSTLTSMPKNSADFASGKVSGKQFLALAKQWETDFGQVKTDVSKLKGPKQLGDTQDIFLQAIDAYVGAARLYQVAALQQQLVDDGTAQQNATKDKATKDALAKRVKADKDQVQVVILHADEARQRADALYQIAQAKLDALKKAWSIAPPATAPSAPNNITVPGQ